MKIRGVQNIPDCAMNLFNRGDDFYVYKTDLDLIVFWYNGIRTSVNKEERPLIQNQLEEIDCQFLKAEKEMDWNNEGNFCFYLFCFWFLKKCSNNEKNAQIIMKKPQRGTQWDSNSLVKVCFSSLQPLHHPSAHVYEVVNY